MSTVEEQKETIANLEKNNLKMRKRYITQSRTSNEQLNCYMNEEQAVNLMKRQRLYPDNLILRKYCGNTKGTSEISKEM